MNKSIRDLIVAVNVSWNQDCANEPVLIIGVDALPQADIGTIYKNVPSEDGGHFLMAELVEGSFDYCYARPMAPEGTPQHIKGNCGRRYEFLLEDGSRLVSDDVWSSNASAVSEAFGIEGDHRLIEVSYALKGDSNITYTGCVSVGLYKELCTNIGLFFNEDERNISAHPEYMAKRICHDYYVKRIAQVSKWTPSNLISKEEISKKIQELTRKYELSRDVGYYVQRTKDL